MGKSRWKLRAKRRRRVRHKTECEARYNQPRREWTEHDGQRRIFRLRRPWVMRFRGGVAIVIRPLPCHPPVRGGTLLEFPARGQLACEEHADEDDDPS